MKNDKLFTIEQLENSENPILERVAGRVEGDDDLTLASHSSHSSSSGRGHTSHVSGTAGASDKETSKK
tara:strand:+ start:262 stop:465 length:204 start_codon:yes stop_codon:yes gene_type:complete